MIVETCAILFLLFICLLVVVAMIKPRKGGTFINFAKQEMKIKEHPVAYASVCFHAVLVIVICLSIAFNIYYRENGLPVMWIPTLILVFLSFLGLLALSATLHALQRVLLRKNPRRQRDILALILALSVTVLLGYHVVGALYCL